MISFMLIFTGAFTVSPFIASADGDGAADTGIIPDAASAEQAPVAAEPAEVPEDNDALSEAPTEADGPADADSVEYSAQASMINITVTVDGTKLKSDVSPKLVTATNRTLIPVRALFEQVGGTVTWNEKKQTVTIKFNDHTIVLTIGSKKATVDGQTKTLDQSAQILSGDRTYIPLRFVAENLGFTVGWNASTQTATVKSPEKPKPSDDPVLTNSISSVKVEYGTEKLTAKVVITSEKALTSSSYKTFSLTGPDRFVIDFINTGRSAAVKNTEGENMNGGYVLAQVRTAMFTQTDLRVVCDLTEAKTPTVSLSSDKKTMTISFGEVTKPYNPYDDGKLAVVLDPGHGKSTAGKRSPDNGETIMEYEFNRDVAYRTKAILEKKGITVYMTVSDMTSDPSLSARYNYANSTDADIFVSFHANAYSPNGEWTDATGWEVFHYPTSFYGKKLATAIRDANKGKIDTNIRGIKTAEFAVIRHTTMPAVLIEHAFFTNKAEAAKMKTDEFRQQCAENDAQGIIDFFNSFKH